MNRFPQGNSFVSGHRCERGRSGEKGAGTGDDNLFTFKRGRLFEAYVPLPAESAPRGVIGIPRVLNMYENYPFWFTFLTALGFSVRLSPYSSRQLFELGMESIPSESACYPAKLVHGHVAWLVRHGVRTIFYPSIIYERQEQPGAANCFNCPMVISYPEVVRANCPPAEDGGVDFLTPFLPYHRRSRLTARLYQEFRRFGITRGEVRRAVGKAWKEDACFKADVRRRGEALLAEVERRGGHGIVLAGRPYHLDPGINHGIAEMVQAQGMSVFTEDSIAHLAEVPRPLRVVDQWMYHSRLYAAASLTAGYPSLDLVQLTSFGCGLDAITADQVKELLEQAGKVHTLLKIDEGENLGAARIRIKSLCALIRERDASIAAQPRPVSLRRPVPFTAEMRDTRTILCPQMAPSHFALLESALNAEGYRLQVLPAVDHAAMELGLRYVNHDACYPAIMVIGQLLQALTSGRYDLQRTAVMMSQTGGGCRATNYLALLRKAMADAGLDGIPVISANLLGVEKCPGFKVTWGMLQRGVSAVVYADLLMAMLHRVRPYEKIPGSSALLYRKWLARCQQDVSGPSGQVRAATVREMVREFDCLEVHDRARPRVGLVGEILV
ncbi:MAG: acyl-CoA dehydratase activase-related protein, partial [Syntrophomonadaceae bacterium]|nr:acyl-CoA dehydratase activase-related protein [Syntrophomonadaceae bacterium]